MEHRNAIVWLSQGGGEGRSSSLLRRVEVGGLDGRVAVIRMEWAKFAGLATSALRQRRLAVEEGVEEATRVKSLFLL